VMRMIARSVTFEPEVFYWLEKQGKEKQMSFSTIVNLTIKKYRLLQPENKREENILKLTEAIKALKEVGYPKEATESFIEEGFR
jgi:hypothetical protein